MSSEPPENQISHFLQQARRVGGEVLKALAVAFFVWYHTPVPCASCRRRFHREAMTQLYDLPRYGTPAWRLFCADCAERLRQDAIYEDIYQEENRKVQIQLRRAMDKGRPATLTTEQWLDTLDHFDEKCAYCLVAPYEALEHVVPIELGGGTTVDN